MAIRNLTSHYGREFRLGRWSGKTAVLSPQNLPQARKESNVLKVGKIYDLAQPLFAGMPHFPTHPPFLRTLTKAHGELVLPNGASSAAEAITMGGHVGTHIDALSLFFLRREVARRRQARHCSPTATGVTTYGVDAVEPIFPPRCAFRHREAQR